MTGQQAEDFAADFILDPAEVAVGRTELPLHNLPIRVNTAGIDWGDAAVSAYLADSSVGSLPVSHRIPNRTISIPLTVRGDVEPAKFHAAKSALMMKVAKIQQTHVGWFKRQPGLYCDVVNATLSFPDQWGAVEAFETGVTLVLECLPEFYGDEIPLDPIDATGDLAAVLSAVTAATLTPDAGGFDTGPGAWTSEDAELEIVTDAAGQYVRASVPKQNVGAEGTVHVSWGELPAGTYQLAFQARNLDRQTWGMVFANRSWEDVFDDYDRWWDVLHDLPPKETP